MKKLLLIFFYFPLIVFGQHGRTWMGPDEFDGGGSFQDGINNLLFFLSIIGGFFLLGIIVNILQSISKKRDVSILSVCFGLLFIFVGFLVLILPVIDPGPQDLGISERLGGFVVCILIGIGFFTQFLGDMFG